MLVMLVNAAYPISTSRSSQDKFAQGEPQCDPVGRRSHVEEETDETNLLVERLGNALNTLEAKMEKVTHSGGPVSGPANGSQVGGTIPAPYRVPLAEKMRSTNNNLVTLIQGLERLILSIEL